MKNQKAIQKNCQNRGTNQRQKSEADDWFAKRGQLNSYQRDKKSAVHKYQYSNFQILHCKQGAEFGLFQKSKILKQRIQRILTFSYHRTPKTNSAKQKFPCLIKWKVAHSLFLLLTPTKLLKILLGPVFPKLLRLLLTNITNYYLSDLTWLKEEGSREGKKSVRFDFSRDKFNMAQ